ncbi:MAG: hypothetical protein CJBNEKGG_00843 [Prosthecobacter sp.]|nr:hypothetical protein [Prosthecobacter sp.]
MPLLPRRHPLLRPPARSVVRNRRPSARLPRLRVVARTPNPVAHALKLKSRVARRPIVLRIQGPVVSVMPAAIRSMIEVLPPGMTGVVGRMAMSAVPRCIGTGIASIMPAALATEITVRAEGMKETTDPEARLRRVVAVSVVKALGIVEVRRIRCSGAMSHMERPGGRNIARRKAGSMPRGVGPK